MNNGPQIHGRLLTLRLMFRCNQLASFRVPERNHIELDQRLQKDPTQIKETCFQRFSNKLPYTPVSSLHPLLSNSLSLSWKDNHFIKRLSASFRLARYPLPQHGFSLAILTAWNQERKRRERERKESDLSRVVRGNFQCFCIWCCHQD